MVISSSLRSLIIALNDVKVLTVLVLLATKLSKCLRDDLVPEAQEEVEYALSLSFAPGGRPVQVGIPYRESVSFPCWCGDACLNSSAVRSAVAPYTKLILGEYLPVAFSLLDSCWRALIALLRSFLVR